MTDHISSITAPVTPAPESQPARKSDVVWSIASGVAAADPASPSISIRGAANNYNSRGNGGTMARRVLRNGSWQWVSRPASRGRYLASDRHDAQYGDVYAGEIIAEYTLGGSSIPDAWYLVYEREVKGTRKTLFTLTATKRRDGRWSLCRKPGDADIILVSDPYWR